MARRRAGTIASCAAASCLLASWYFFSLSNYLKLVSDFVYVEMEWKRKRRLKFDYPNKTRMFQCEKSEENVGGFPGKFARNFSQDGSGIVKLVFGTPNSFGSLSEKAVEAFKWFPRNFSRAPIFGPPELSVESLQICRMISVAQNLIQDIAATGLSTEHQNRPHNYRFCSQNSKAVFNAP